MDRHTGCDHQRRKGWALRPPSTPPTINDTRGATPSPPRGRTDTDREEPDLQGGRRGAEATRSSRQPTPTPCCTRGEPPLHLDYETGSYLSMRSAEVANHHKPPPTCIGHSIRQSNPSPALSPGKVGPQHRRPATGHRRQAGNDPADPRSPPPPSPPHAWPPDAGGHLTPPSAADHNAAAKATP
jgi:hypothetical protein